MFIVAHAGRAVIRPGGAPRSVAHSLRVHVVSSHRLPMQPRMPFACFLCAARCHGVHADEGQADVVAKGADLRACSARACGAFGAGRCADMSIAASTPAGSSASAFFPCRCRFFGCQCNSALGSWSKGLPCAHMHRDTAGRGLGSLANRQVSCDLQTVECVLAMQARTSQISGRMSP